MQHAPPGQRAFEVCDAAGCDCIVSTVVVATNEDRESTLSPFNERDFEKPHTPRDLTGDYDLTWWARFPRTRVGTADIDLSVVPQSFTILRSHEIWTSFSRIFQEGACKTGTRRG